MFPRRRQTAPIAPPFVFPTPTHADKNVQLQINRVAYLLRLIEINLTHYQELLLQENDLRELMKKRVLKLGGKDLRQEQAAFTSQLENLTAERRALPEENDKLHEELRTTIAELPDDVDTYSLFAGRIEQL